MYNMLLTGLGWAAEWLGPKDHVAMVSTEGEASLTSSFGNVLNSKLFQNHLDRAAQNGDDFQTRQLLEMQRTLGDVDYVVIIDRINALRAERGITEVISTDRQ